MGWKKGTEQYNNRGGQLDEYWVDVTGLQFPVLVLVF